MFGSAELDTSQVDTWKDLLRQAEPYTQRGALVAKNLEEDGNVPAETAARFCQMIDRIPAPSVPNQAASPTSAVIVVSPCHTRTGP